MIAVVSHDAGGAEILSSYLRQQELESLFVLEGPARKIFECKMGGIQILPLEEALRQAESILCGTSWQSELEFNALRLAGSLGKRSVAFLDHWTNYRERFVRSGESCLPDEIWVGDSCAESMAIEIFPGLPVRLIENPYFQDIRRKLNGLPMRRSPSSGGISVLYVCEPIREHGRLQFDDERHWGYVEEEALRYFLVNISVLGRSIDRILIRPHPSEPRNKYAWAQHEFDLPIMQGGTKSLVEEIAEADVVVGCESMAMVIALFAGRRVVSSIPPGGKACVLPQREIESLQVLLRESQKMKDC